MPYSAGCAVKSVVVSCFFCVFLKIVIFVIIGFIKLWLNELFGLVMFGVGHCDCYVISICCDLYVFWW